MATQAKKTYQMSVETAPEKSLCVAIRADASPEIGMGHIMRCNALASELAKRGHQTVLVTRARSMASLKRTPTAFDQILPIQDRVFPGDAADAEASLLAVGQRKVDAWVLDSYTLDLEWETKIAAVNPCVAVIEDRPWRQHLCKVLIDPSSGVDAQQYAAFIPPDCRVLSALDSALIRPEFLDLRRSQGRRKKTGLRDILVFPGGGRQPELVSLFLQGIAQSGIEVKVLVLAPGLSAECGSFRSKMSAASQCELVFLDFVSDPSRLIHRADLVIGCAGGSAWERCCLGAPSLSVIAEPNQRGIAQHLAQCGATINLGMPGAGLVDDLDMNLSLLALEPALLERMSVQAWQACDGGGCARVSDALEAMLIKHPGMRAVGSNLMSKRGREAKTTAAMAAAQRLN